MTIAPEAPALLAARRPATSRWARQAWKPALVGSVIGGGLWTAIHGVAGVAWIDVAAVFRGLQLRQIGLLSVIWISGLAVYASVLSAALPGLGMRRGLVMNLSGSAVANVIPLGGAVATGVNWRMARTWGHSNVAFAAFCVLTNALDVATKLLLPVIAVLALAVVSVHVPLALWAIAAACAAVLLLIWAIQAVALRPGSRAMLKSAAGHPDEGGRLHTFGRQLRQTVLSTRRLLLAHWGRLVPASLGYVALQVVLLVFSLRAVGLHAPVTVVLMAAAIERLSTLVPVTPGGVGVAEIGTIAWLVANGLDPVEVVAGVLVYRIILIAMEIPVGGVLLFGWIWRHGWRGAEAGSQPQLG